MDMNTVRGIITLLAMLFFIVICILVYSKRNKNKYEKASRMVLDAESNENSDSEVKN